MSDYKAIYISDDTQNWFRNSLAVRFVREGIVTFVQDEIKKMHHDIFQNIAATNSLPPGTTCSSCTTPSVLPCPTRGMCRVQRGRCNYHPKPTHPCPNNLCGGVRQQIENEHRFHGPSWCNTNAQDWCGNSWETAKCFMPPDGYSEITVADDTDFNGIINTIINCKRFETLFDDDLTRGNNICTKAREVGRNIRHCPNCKIDASTATNNFDILIKLLEDPMCLKSDKHAMEAKKKILELRVLGVTESNAPVAQPSMDPTANCMTPQIPQPYIGTQRGRTVGKLDVWQQRAETAVENASYDVNLRGHVDQPMLVQQCAPETPQTPQQPNFTPEQLQLLMMLQELKKQNLNNSVLPQPMTVAVNNTSYASPCVIPAQAESMDDSENCDAGAGNITFDRPHKMLTSCLKG